jgi:phosphopantothenate---cysteine ligase (CTP)
MRRRICLEQPHAYNKFVMNFLITAGNTQTPIDRVRCITNIFTGRTGAQIALEAHSRGHAVTLLTSHPEAIGQETPRERWRLVEYRTFDILESEMCAEVLDKTPDVIIHAAAVSDYRAAGIFAPSHGTHFDVETSQWVTDGFSHARLEDRAAPKVRSSEPELWLRLIRAPKIVDRIRSDWRFKGLLVKFKLEVDVSDETLEKVAEHSRLQSAADLMVANTLEAMHAWALLGPVDGRYQKIPRRELAERLILAVERRTTG